MKPGITGRWVDLFIIPKMPRFLLVHAAFGKKKKNLVVVGIGIGSGRSLRRLWVPGSL